jgi:hypothetical protein
MMLRCPRASELISQGLDRRLWWVERLRLALHLLGCRSCARFGRAARWLHRELPRAEADDRLSPAARERLRRALSDAESRG